MKIETLKATVEGDVLKPEERLNLPDGTEVELEINVREQPQKRRTFGSAKGKIEIMEDFDEPLPEFEEYTT